VHKTSPPARVTAAHVFAAGFCYNSLNLDAGEKTAKRKTTGGKQ
jgi:hypothetical protein